jgi:hypothetical protein
LAEEVTCHVFKFRRIKRVEGWHWEEYEKQRKQEERREE